MDSKNLYDHDHGGHRERMRQRVNNEGLDFFSDHQVLEYVLTFAVPRRDTNVLAHKLVEHFGSFAGVLEASPKDLMAVKGVGQVTASMLSSLLKVFQYYEKSRAKAVAFIKTPADAKKFVRPLLASKAVEELYLICMKSNGKVLSACKLAEGDVAEAKVSMRAVMEEVTRTKATCVIVAHNHPNGVASPSKEDDNFTKSLIMSLTISGIEVSDHIILADDKFYSYRSDGTKLQEYQKTANQFISDDKLVAQEKSIYSLSTTWDSGQSAGEK